jgi:tetratricopeptide (TPR) repeat protein
MLDLSSVTLCAVDCVNHLLTLRALDLCGRQCRFGEMMFLSDSANQFELAGCRMEPIPRIGSRAEYSRFVLKELGRYCRTKHVLLVQWDGYVINPDAWRPEFLDYDYIGAPWGSYQDGHRVGNGGFSLRSRRLLDALADAVIVDLDPEDEAIGRRYRTLLESKHGIRFAPEEIAEAFSFETTYPKGRPFGFHGLFNMWLVLPQQELVEFVSALAPSSVAGRQFLQLGKNYLELGRKEEAAVVLKRRLEVTPEDTEAGRLLASITSPASISPPSANRGPGRNDPCPCGSGKRYKQCCGNIAGARQAPTPPPSAGHPGVLLQNAMDHHQAGRLEAAEALYRRVLEDDPQNAVALQYLGVLSMQRDNPAHGEVLIRQALDIRSDIPDFHNNLGLCLRQQGRLREAQACYRQALAIKPDYAAAYNNLGLDLQATGEMTEAVTAFRKALQLQPQFAEAHWNLGLAYLTQGNLAEGWAEYEWRLRCQPFSGDGLVLNSIAPWRGESIAGKTLLVRGEQGFGDTIQFLRFVPRLIQSGAKVLLDVPPDLAELSQTIAPAVELLDRTVPHPKADFYVNLTSLPYWQGITLDNLPRATPYLSADPAKVALWQARLGAFSGKKIGIVWGGNPKFAMDRYRSPGLAVLLPLLQTPRVAWVSLQKEQRSGDAALLSRIPGIHDFTSQLADFSETAALIDALDLVITSDTSVAHLTGALGKPAWVMIHYAPDWRWQLDREDSPWYPSIRLFRQQKPGNWKDVMVKMQDALRDAVR